jgi:hypothetical protein
MEAAQLFRLAGLAAVIGGGLRIAAVLPLGLSAQAAEALYDAVDILLLFGLVGIYLARAEALGFLGLASFAVGVAALSFIGGPDADPFGFSTYREGATVLAIAMAGLAIAWISRRQRPIWPPILWFASVIAAGVLTSVAPSLSLAVAGAFFGAGFVAAGLDLLRKPA